MIRWSGTLIAPNPPQIDIAVAGRLPAGFLPLSLFGVAPIGGVGDESIVNFNVPTFSTAGELQPHRTTSNGYIVFGGGRGPTSASSRSLPNPTAPNNVLAPFWTDLNRAAGGVLGAGTLTDGTTMWLVLYWKKVRIFGRATRRSFQIWIEPAPAAESVWYTFGPAAETGASPDP